MKRSSESIKRLPTAMLGAVSGGVEGVSEGLELATDEPKHGG
jgi:hypothetical protein